MRVAIQLYIKLCPSSPTAITSSSASVLHCCIIINVTCKAKSENDPSETTDDPNKSNVFQELDDAFTTLDQELESDAVADGVRTLDPDEDRTQDPDSATKGDKSGLIVSAPTPI